MYKFSKTTRGITQQFFKFFFRHLRTEKNTRQRISGIRSSEG